MFDLCHKVYRYIRKCVCRLWGTEGEGGGRKRKRMEDEGRKVEGMKEGFEDKDGSHMCLYILDRCIESV